MRTTVEQAVCAALAANRCPLAGCGKYHNARTLALGACARKLVNAGYIGYDYDHERWVITGQPSAPAIGATLWRQTSPCHLIAIGRLTDWADAETCARLLSREDGGTYVATADESLLRAEFRNGQRAPGGES